MSGDRIAYVQTSSYKYRLVEAYELRLSFPLAEPCEVAGFVRLVPAGMGARLEVCTGYAWDGPSGPTFDTRSFLRGSLVHDALYQLLRTGRLPSDPWRLRADVLLRDLCREDGMSWFRSAYVYAAVRVFGGRAARARPEAQAIVLFAP